jgi:hypothetical protein
VRPHIYYCAGFWRMLTPGGTCMAAAPTVRSLSDYVTHPWFKATWS